MLHEKTNLPIQQILKEVLEHRKAKGDDKHAYTSFYDDDPETSNLQILTNHDEILDTILRYSQSYIDACIIEPDGPNKDLYRLNRRFIQVWYNVYDEGIHHCWHDHGRSFLSGTIFINLDDQSSPYRIKSPLYPLIKAWSGDGDLRGRWAQELSFRPDNGDILIWPGWVEHTVPEQKACNKERVTLSFNISVKR